MRSKTPTVNQYMGKNIQLLFVFGYPNMVTEHQLKKIRDENFEFKDLLIPSKYSDPSLVMHFFALGPDGSRITYNLHPACKQV